MDIDQKSPVESIVHAASHSLTVRSAVLVARGLRDLTCTSNWLCKRVFAGHASHLAISPAGQICILSPIVGSGTRHIAIYDIEVSNVSPAELSPTAEATGCSADLLAVFAWSPTAQYLVAAAGPWKPELHVFDLTAGTVLKGFGQYSIFPSFLTWSDAGGLFAVASAGSKNASLRVWNVSPNEAPSSDSQANTLGILDGLERQTSEAEFSEEGAFSGYGRTAFSPNEELLVVALEFKGDWADDSILVADVQSLQRRNVFQAQGHITDLSWTQDSQQVIYCTGGHAYRLTVGAMTSEELSFAAELCLCHPFLPICVCFSSWLRNSAKGRLYIFDLNRLEIFDECAAEGIVTLRWSRDGSKAYAMTEDGLAYIYELSIF